MGAVTPSKLFLYLYLDALSGQQIQPFMLQFYFVSPFWWTEALHSVVLYGGLDKSIFSKLSCLWWLQLQP